MHKKSYFIFVFCVMVNLIHAQDIPFKTLKSEIFTDEYRKSDIALAESDGKGGIIVARSYEGTTFSYGTGYYFEQYDANLNLVKNQEYNMERPVSQKYSVILGLFNSGNAIQIIEMYYDLKEKACACIGHSIATADFKATKKELFRLTTDEMDQYGYLNLRELFFSGSYKLWKTNLYPGYFFYPGNNSVDFFGNASMENENTASGVTFVINEDKTAFGIGIDLAARKSETLKVYLFDTNLNKKTEQYFRPGLKDNKFHYQTFEVSKDGNAVYLLGKAYDKKSKKKQEGGKYEYELTKFDLETQKTMAFDSGEHFIGSLKMLFLENKLTCIGFYSDKKDTRTKGICYFEIDPLALELKKSKYNPFTEQFIIDKYGKEKDKELKYLTFRKFLVTGNQDIMFNAEEVYANRNSSYSGGFGGGGVGGGVGIGVGSSTTYNYGDIVTAKINADGNLVWARNINKSQSTTDDENSYISYTSMIKDGDNYFFINAAEKIKKISNNRIEFKGVGKNRSNLNVIRVNQSGDFDYQEILDDEQNEVPFMVSKGVVSDGAIYFLGRRGKKKQLLKITL